MFPSNFPVFVWIRRLHDELVARKLVNALQVLADQRSNERTFYVIGEGVRRLVNLVSPKGSFVPALRILDRTGLGRRPRVAIHDLNRHVTVARVKKQSNAVSPMYFSICILFFEPGKPPRSDKSVANVGTYLAILASVLCQNAGRGDSEKQKHEANRDLSFHVGSVLLRDPYAGFENNSLAIMMAVMALGQPP